MAASKKSPFSDSFPTAEIAKPHGWLHTGNFALNWAISGRFHRGWPLGLATEIFGDPSTGKTLLILAAIAQAQAKGGIALMDDVEGRYNPTWGAQKFGIDNSRLGYAHSATVKEHHEVVKKFISILGKMDGEPPAVLALDSAANLTTEFEQEKAFEKRDLKRAQDFHTLFRTMGKPLRQVPAAYLIANHVIANIGDFINPRTTPTGGAIKYQSSVRLDLRTPSKIKHLSTKEYIGVIIRVFVEKNSVAAPWKEVRIAIPFYNPINPLSGLIPVLLDLGILGEDGLSLTYQGKDTGVRTNKSNFLKQDASASKLLREYPDLLEAADAELEEREDQISVEDGDEEDDGEG